MTVACAVERTERRASRANQQRTCRLELAAVPNAVGLARLHTADVCKQWLIPHVIETAELIVSELMTNAIRHAAQDVRRVALTLALTAESFFIKMFDHDSRPPVVGESGPMDESGRGLFLVESLSRNWNFYIPGQGGKVIWCELSLSEPEEVRSRREQDACLVEVES